MKQAHRGVGPLGGAEPRAASTARPGQAWLQPDRSETALENPDLPVVSLWVK